MFVGPTSYGLDRIGFAASTGASGGSKGVFGRAERGLPARGGRPVFLDAVALVEILGDFGIIDCVSGGRHSGGPDRRRYLVAV